jgi:5-carboxymethyl-2-hydroxymuconate isomerase
MPHLIIEYSANVVPTVDIGGLVRAVHAAALETGVFPIGGLRTRAFRHDLYAVADLHPDNGFIHVQARIGAGRTPEVRQQAADHIFAAVKHVTADAFARGPLGLTLEIVEIDPVGALKHNNLHDAVAARAAKKDAKSAIQS